MDMNDIHALLQTQGDAIDTFQKKQVARLDDLEEHVKQMALKAGRPAGLFGDAATDHGTRWLQTKNGRALILPREAKAVDALRGTKSDEGFSIGDFVRDAMLGAPEGKAASSAATVPTLIGGEVIDRVRAATVLVQAGASTIYVEGPTNLAKITGDPTVHAHTEAANDITESDVTLAAVNLNPQLLAALVPLSVEVVQDSPNLDAVLQTSLAAAFAAKIDTLGIAAIVAASGLPVSAAAHDPATWTGTNLAIAAALAANQGLPMAHISTAANYAARSVILASTAGSWLGKPPYLSGMRELFTTSMTADTAIFGDFSRGCALVARSELRLEVIRHGKPGYGSHLLVAHARMAIVPLQVATLFYQKKVP